MDGSDDSRAAAGQAGSNRGWGMLARAGHLEYDRVLFFSDAVFAIAITLLIVDLPVEIGRASSSPGHHTAINSATELKNAVPGMVGFGISFGVIGLFWIGHHWLFRFITAFDRPLMLLNLLFLGTIAFLPYPTELLSSVSSSQAPAVIFYAACAGTAGLVETVLWVYALHAREGLVTGIDAGTRRLILLRTARVPAVFGASILIALASPLAATYFWLALAVSGVVLTRLYARHEPSEPAEPDETAELPGPGPV
jgi:uncharacterized membrane protein